MKKNIFNNRRFKHGTLATVMTVGLVALVVIVNIVVSMIADRLPINVDLTANKLYELSDESIDFLDNMDASVKIELFATEEDFKTLGNNYGFSEFAGPALELLKKYDNYDNITVEYLDPYTNPDVISKYPDANLTLGSVVVSCEDRHRMLALTDLFTVDMQTGYVTQTNVENAITSSIIVVSNADPTRITLLTGVTTGDVSGLTNLLINNGYELQQTDILTGEISNDTEILILASPMTDIPEESLKKIDRYLDSTGEYNRNFYYFADPSQPKLPNVEAFLSEWGIGIGDGIVLESDTNRIYYSSTFVEQNFADSIFADELGNLDGYLYLAQYRPINPLFEENANRTVKTILSSYSSGVLMPFNADENWTFTNDDKDKYPSVVMGERTVVDSTSGKESVSSVVAFGSTTITNATFLGQSVFKNAEYLIVMSNALCEKTDVNIVAPKSAGNETLGISDTNKVVINTIFQYLLPIAIIIIGVVVWIRRRNR